MVTLTITNVPQHVVQRLEALARRRNTSIEQEIRDLLEEHVGDHDSVLKQIEASWDEQSGPRSAAEIDAWIAARRDE